MVFYAQSTITVISGQIKGDWGGGGGWLRKRESERELKHCLFMPAMGGFSPCIVRCSTCVIARGSRDKGVGNKGSRGGGGGLKRAGMGWYGMTERR